MTNKSQIVKPQYGNEINSEQNYLEKELYELIKSDESIFRFMQDSALDGLWFWDLEKPENEWMNPKFWTTLGYDPSKMPHSPSSWQNIINQEDLQTAMTNFDSHCKDPSHPYDQVVRYKHKLGHTIWIHCRGLAIRNAKGEPFRMLGAHTDISDLKKTEQKLKNQIEKYQHIVDGTNIGIWEWNIETGAAKINETFADALGYSISKLKSFTVETWRENTHIDDVKKSDKLLKEHFAGITPYYECEVRLQHKNGEWIWFHQRGKVVSWTSNGQPEWMIGSHQEITKSTKEFIRHQEFIRQAPTAIAMFDTKMHYLAYSKKWLFDYAINDENIVGKSHYAIFPEIGDDLRKDHQECMNGKIIKSDETRLERSDGSVQWVSRELRPWYTDTNKIGGIIMYTADITEKKMIEVKLRVSEETFRGNFENAAIGMGIVSLQGKWEKVNQSLCNMMGYTAEELYNLTFQDVTHPDDLHIGKNKMPELLNGSISATHLEKRYLHKKGHAIHTILSTSLVRDELNSPVHFLAQITNITPRVKAKEKMQMALAKIESIFKSSTHVSIIATNPEGVITAFNKGAENLLGYSKEEVLHKETPVIIHASEEVSKRGKELSEMFNEEITGFDIFIRATKNGEHDTREWTYIRKDGSRFPVQLTITAVKEGNTIVGYMGVAMDISEIKKAEKEIRSLLRVTEEQNDRLINFANIVSHNLNSHSGNFSMLLDLFVYDYPEYEDNVIINLLRKASDNLTDTIVHLNEIVLMNTTTEQNLVKLNIRDTIEEVTSGLLGIAEDSFVIIKNRTDPNANILGVAAYLESILLNFITNGIKYSSPKRDSYIELSTQTENEYVILNIKDNGLGIDLDKYQEKLFGMYKTFHNNKDSRGIGLFITKNQVEAIGGKIKVESKVDHGTTFKIYFKHEKK